MERRKASFEEYSRNFGNVTDYKNPTCIDCNSCCGALTPISKKELFTIKQEVTKNKKLQKIYKARIKEMNEHLKAGDLDMTCLFSDHKTKKCLIYNIRPLVCRSFHCSPELNVYPEELIRLPAKGVYYLGDVWGMPCKKIISQVKGE